MTFPSTVDVLQWRFGRHTPTITQPINPSSTATTSTIGSMTPRRPSSQATVNPDLSLFQSGDKNQIMWFGSDSSVVSGLPQRDVPCSTDTHNDLYLSLSLRPLSPHTFFYTPETEQVFIGSFSGSNGHLSLLMTRGVFCLLDVLAHVCILWMH